MGVNRVSRELDINFIVELPPKNQMHLWNLFLLVNVKVEPTFQEIDWKIDSSGIKSETFLFLNCEIRHNFFIVKYIAIFSVDYLVTALLFRK